MAFISNMYIEVLKDSQKAIPPDSNTLGGSVLRLAYTVVMSISSHCLPPPSPVPQSRAHPFGRGMERTTVRSGPFLGGRMPYARQPNTQIECGPWRPVYGKLLQVSLVPYLSRLPLYYSTKISHSGMPVHLSIAYRPVWHERPILAGAPPSQRVRNILSKQCFLGLWSAPKLVVNIEAADKTGILGPGQEVLEYSRMFHIYDTASTTNVWILVNHRRSFSFPHRPLPPHYRHSFHRMEDARRLSGGSPVSLELGEHCEKRGRTRSKAGKQSGA